MIILYDDENKKTPETKGLADKLSKQTGKRVPAFSLDQLEITIETGKPVKVQIDGRNLEEFGLVYFRTIARARDLAAIAAGYLSDKNAPFVDSEALPNIGVGKIHQMYLLHKQSFHIPTSYTGTHKFIRSLIGNKLSLPFIYKANTASKGTHNYLINSVEEFDNVVAVNKSRRFIAQEYLQNSEDYRFLVFGNRVGIIIKRQGNGESHLNNTSQGANASLIQVSDINVEIINTAISAARILRREIAGVDIIIDPLGKPVILEVNRTPQLATGSFVDEKLNAFNDYINSL